MATFEIRSYDTATIQVRDGERETLMGAPGAVLATFDAPYPGAAHPQAVKMLGDLGFNTANYVTDTDSPTIACWYVSPTRLIALLPVAR